MSPLYVTDSILEPRTYGRPEDNVVYLNGMTVCQSRKKQAESRLVNFATSAEPSTNTRLYERGLTFLAALIPRFNVTTDTRHQQLIALDTISLEDFSTCPLMRALSSYHSVPLRSLLPTIYQDYQTKTSRYSAAELFTEQMAMDYQRIPKSTLKNLLSLGSGSTNIQEVWPCMQLFMETIDLLCPEQGDRATGSVLRDLFIQAQKYPGSRNHRLISSFLSAQGDTTRTEKTARPAVKHDTSAWSVKAFFAGILGTLWTQYSTATAEDSHRASRNTTRTRNCTVAEFPCANGLCIDRVKICDSYYDCGLNDRSDELPELCPEHCEDTQRFLCKTVSQCIPKIYHCDGDFDCQDGSDEVSPPCPCPQHTILCDDGKRCVDENTLCDGNKECDDGSDESFQHCENKFRDKIRLWLEQSPANRRRLNKVCCGQDANPMKRDDLYKHHGIMRKKCSEIAKYRRRDDCASYACRDGKAESYWCKPYSYMNAGCIRTSHLCDGKHFCQGEQDEVTDFCYLKCPDSNIACGEGTCINPDQLCDGQQHCPNGRDEDPYTCILEHVRIYLKKSCKFYQNDKTLCRTKLRESCCGTSGGFSVVTPAPMNISTITTPRYVFFHSTSSNSNINAPAAPQCNYPVINPASLGLGMVIGCISTVLLGGIVKLCLNTYYRSQSSDDLDSTNLDTMELTSMVEHWNETPDDQQPSIEEEPRYAEISQNLPRNAVHNEKHEKTMVSIPDDHRKPRDKPSTFNIGRNSDQPDKAGKLTSFAISTFGISQGCG